MKVSAKVTYLVLYFALVLLLVAGDMRWHGGRFRRPKVADDGSQSGDQSAAIAKGVSFPGGGPQIPFDEARWEYWWDYNYDPLVALKSKLFSLTPEAGAIDFPYEKVTTANRTKLIRFIVNTYRVAKDPQIREAAILSLARSNDESVVPWLEHAYEEDPHLYVRTTAVIALGLSQVRAAIPILESIFNDPAASSEFRSFAAVAVGLAGGAEASALFKKWLEPKAFRELERFIQQSVAFGAGLTEDTGLGPFLRSALVENTSDDRLTVSYLLISLGLLKDRAANAILIENLAAKDVQARRSAAIALGVTATPSDKDAVEGLIRMIDTESDNITKNFCFVALGSIGGDAAVAFLTEQLDAASRTYLPYVALGAGLTRNPSVRAPLLRKFNETKDLNSRGAIAVALGLSGCREAMGDIRKAVDEQGAPVPRSYYALALGLIGDTESIGRLTEAYVTSNDPELQNYVAMALGLLGDRSIVREMYGLLADRSTPDIRRLSTAYNLGFVGDQKAIDPLVAVIGSATENERVRAFALLGLGHLIDPRPVDVASAITRNNNYTILDNFLFELYHIP